MSSGSQKRGLIICTFLSALISKQLYEHEGRKTTGSTDISRGITSMMLYRDRGSSNKMLPVSAVVTKVKRPREGPLVGAGQRPPERTPTDVVKSILMECDDGGAGGSGYSVTFTKPSEGDIASYDLELVRAVRTKNLDHLRQLWVRGKSMDACNQFGESLLHMACRRGDLPIVNFLLFEANVRTDRCDDFGRNAFHDAMWTSKPNFAVVDALMGAAHPGLLLATDVRGNPPFAYARSEHNAKWVTFLEDRRGRLQQRCADATSASSPSFSTPPSLSLTTTTTKTTTTLPEEAQVSTPSTTALTPIKNEDPS
jgi:Ankyrin repeats (3 copies)